MPQLAAWRRADRVVDALTLLIGGAMMLYVGVAVFGLVRSSAQHYAAFVLFVMVMSFIASLKLCVGERLGKKHGEEGYEEAGTAPERMPRLTWAKGAIAIAGSVLAITGAAYILINADRLEKTAPFFVGLDMTMGAIFTVGILMVTLVHWGVTLTTFVVLAIAYFFYGQH